MWCTQIWKNVFEVTNREVITNDSSELALRETAGLDRIFPTQQNGQGQAKTCEHGAFGGEADRKWHASGISPKPKADQFFSLEKAGAKHFS